jgi:hypothetical protein
MTNENEKIEEHVVVRGAAHRHQSDLLAGSVHKPFKPPDGGGDATTLAPTILSDAVAREIGYV